MARFGSRFGAGGGRGCCARATRRGVGGVGARVVARGIRVGTDGVATKARRRPGDGVPVAEGPRLRGAVAVAGGRLRGRPLSLILRSLKLVTGGADPVVARVTGPFRCVTGS